MSHNKVDHSAFLSRPADISRNAISRLYQYRKSLHRLKQLGFVRVFSENLADAVSVTASQVRRDFSVFGLSGNKRGGYLIDDLIRILDHKLGKDREQRVIIVGAGNVGRALLHYKGFEREGIRVLAVFDNDPSKVTRDSAVPVLPMAELKEFVKQNGVEVGVIAVPDVQAQAVLEELAKSKIRGVLNFAPIRLNPPSDDLVVNHVDLGLELETVIYLVNSLDKKRTKSEGAHK